MQERYRVFVSDSEYQAKEGDAVLVDMTGYLLREDGSRGDRVPSLCSSEMNVSNH